MPAQSVLPDAGHDAVSGMAATCLGTELGSLEPGLQCGFHTDRPCTQAFSCLVPSLSGAHPPSHSAYLPIVGHRGGRKEGTGHVLGC